MNENWTEVMIVKKERKIVASNEKNTPECCSAG